MNRPARLAFVIILAIASARAEPLAKPFRIVGYLPEYRMEGFDPQAASHLTDLLIFSAEPAANGDLDLQRLKNVPWKKLQSFKTRQQVRLVLCVGGWDRSANFAAVSLDDQKRARFVRSAVQTCLERRLDGLDLDWEHPKNEAEQQGYARLLKDLKAAFEEHGLVLSVTMAAWQNLPRDAFAAVDWVNVMSYDNDGRHSTFESAEADVKKLTADGAPAAKLTLGIPLYGRDVKRRETVMTYSEIVAKHHPAADQDEVGTMYFNGPAMVARKTKFALNSGLAGVMVWEIGQDASGKESLVQHIRKTAHNNPKRD